MSDDETASEKKGRPEDSGGIRPTDAEYEARIRIVENLIVAGRASSVTEVKLELKKRGRELANSTVSKYLSLARERLTKSDEKLKAMRRETLLRTLLSTTGTIQRLLNQNETKPRWNDLIQALRLLSDQLGEDSGPSIGAPLPGEGVIPDEGDEERLESKTKAQLDSLLLELLERAEDAVPDTARDQIVAEIKAQDQLKKQP